MNSSSGQDNNAPATQNGSKNGFARGIPLLFLAVLAALKIGYAFNLRINSDETEHLHVVWGWANGLFPYRDLFDNHSPLFQLIYAPLFAAIGERVSIVSWMRLAVIPLYFLCLWVTYQLGKTLFSKRVGLWTAVIAGAYPPFFIKSSEFRTDDLWAALWLLAVLALVHTPYRAGKSFLAGLALGAAFCTSMKTSLLAVSLAVGGAVVGALKLWRRETISFRRLFLLSGAGLLGFVLLPAITIGFFQVHGALSALYYCLVEHNLFAPFLCSLDRPARFADPASAAAFHSRRLANQLATLSQQVTIVSF